MPTTAILFHPKILVVVSYLQVFRCGRPRPCHSVIDVPGQIMITLSSLLGTWKRRARRHVTLYVRTPLTSASCVIAWTQSSATALCSSYPLLRDQYRPLRAHSGFTKLHTLTMKKFSLAMTPTHQGACFRGFMRWEMNVTVRWNFVTS